MESLTTQAYYAECRAIAADCSSRAANDGEDLHDLIHADVDSHQWIIYAAFYNMEVLRISNNTNAYFDDFGPLEAADFSGAVQKMASAAFYTDVCAELDTFAGDPT